MKTQIKPEDAIGRTVSGVASSFSNGGMLLAFADGTFVCLGVSRGYESGDEEIEHCELDLSTFGDEQIVNAGVATQEELFEMRVARDTEARAAMAARQDDRDRADYERLRAKFEGRK